MACYRSDNIHLIRYLIENGADIHAATEDGVTPLHEAVCRLRSEALIELLLEKGAQVNTCSKSSGITPLMEAARQGNLFIADLLLKAGALLNARDSMGWTPFFHAIGSDESDMVKLLMAYGADLDNLAEDKRNCLHLAADFGRMEL